MFLLDTLLFELLLVLLSRFLLDLRAPSAPKAGADGRLDGLSESFQLESVWLDLPHFEESEVVPDLEELLLLVLVLVCLLVAVPEVPEVPEERPPEFRTLEEPVVSCGIAHYQTFSLEL